MSCEIDRSKRNEVLDRLWPLREPLNSKSLTIEEWTAIGGDPEFPVIGNADRVLTLLEKAAAERLAEALAAQPWVDFR